MAILPKGIYRFIPIIIKIPISNDILHRNKKKKKLKFHMEVRKIPNSHSNPEQKRAMLDCCNTPPQIIHRR
jgi:hypothetical protein